jgi:uncharacterized protein
VAFVVSAGHRTGVAATSGAGRGPDLSSDGLLHLSVRGEARQTVAPDSVEVAGRVVVAEPAKPDAVRAAAAALDELTRNLATLGGTPFTVETARSPLTWSAYSVATQVEREHNRETGRSEPTGRVLATVNVVVAARDFGLLGPLGVVFARQDAFYVDGVSWHVDDDNPAWAAVRAGAIDAAVRKGNDYASALGSSLTGIEHIADTGLLGGSGPGVPVLRAASRMLTSTGGGDDLDAPSLDPVPQELTAVIEARFSASPVSMT